MMDESSLITSERSIQNNFNSDEEGQENNQKLVVPKKKKVSKNRQVYVEMSKNKKYSRSDEKKYSEKYHTAYLGFDHDRACDVIWNTIDITSLEEDKITMLFNEFNRLKQLNHENILEINDVWIKESQDKLIFITDYFSGGSIRQFLRRFGSQKLKVIKSWLKMILKGLAFIHNNGFIFRDLNCGRINYESKSAHICIGDLIVSSEAFYNCFEEREHEMFVPNCMSPEIINQNHALSYKTDIWSLGMVLIEMITLDVPYNECSTYEEIINNIKLGILPKDIQKITNDDIKKFILKLLEKDPNKRPTIEQILNDEYNLVKISFLKFSEQDGKIVKISKFKRKKEKETSNNDKFKLNIKKKFEEEPYNVIPNYETLIKSEKMNVNEFIKKKNSNFFPIFDNDYNVKLKFYVNEGGKSHMIGFTYNLLKDNIDTLMSELQSFFNLNEENLKNIYESLKKICKILLKEDIYSKFYIHSQDKSGGENSNILPDNSI